MRPTRARARVGACLEKKQLRDREQKNLVELEKQRRRADELLHVIFPKSIAAELKEHNRVKPRHHPNVAVLFSDITGFTSYCDQNPPEVVIDNLQKLVRSFEEIAERHGVEKIKTIGDAFMATAGRYTPGPPWIISAPAPPPASSSSSSSSRSKAKAKAKWKSSKSPPIPPRWGDSFTGRPATR
jgi:class 3 adenylate cyclase